MLVVAASLALPSTAYADAQGEARPHMLVGGPVGSGVRLALSVAHDPAALDTVFGTTAAATGPTGRTPTWVGPEMQRPQYHTTLVELVF